MNNAEIVSSHKSQPDSHVSCTTALLDGAKSLIQDGLINPVWNGAGQLITFGHLPQVSILDKNSAENAKNSTLDAWSQKIGGGVGMAADLLLLNKFVKTGAFAGAAEADTASSISLSQKFIVGAKQGAKLGALYGAFFTPSDPKGSLLGGRLKNVITDGITFGALSGGAEALGGIKAFESIKQGTLAGTLKNMSVMGAVGLPVGAIGSVTDSILNRKSISLSAIKSEALSYGVVGAALAGLPQVIPQLSNSADQASDPATSAAESGTAALRAAVQPAGHADDLATDFERGSVTPASAGSTNPADSTTTSSTHAGSKTEMPLTFKDGTEAGRAWRRYYDGPEAVFPVNELDAPSTMAADTTIGANEEGTFRVQAHGPHNRVEGFLIGGHLGDVEADPTGERPLAVNWYTAVNPDLQGGGIGERLATNVYSTEFAQNPNAIIVAEIEHTGIDMTKVSQAPSTAEVKAAVRQGDPSTWTLDQNVNFTDQVQEVTQGKYTDRQQTRARYAFWTRGRTFVPETQADQAEQIGAATGLKPTIIRRSWDILDPKNPDDPEANAAGHILVWTKDGEPISREAAHEVLSRLYTSENGYDVGEDNFAVQKLEKDWQEHPELFDSVPVAPDKVRSTSGKS